MRVIYKKILILGMGIKIEYTHLRRNNRKILTWSECRGPKTLRYGRSAVDLSRSLTAAAVSIDKKA